MGESFNHTSHTGTELETLYFLFVTRKKGYGWQALDFLVKHGAEKGVPFRATIHTVHPCLTFGWTGKACGIYATHNGTLAAKEGATLLKTEESMQGVLASLLKECSPQTCRKP